MSAGEGGSGDPGKVERGRGAGGRRGEWSIPAHPPGPRTGGASHLCVGVLGTHTGAAGFPNLVSLCASRE